MTYTINRHHYTEIFFLNFGLQFFSELHTFPFGLHILVGLHA